MIELYVALAVAMLSAFGVVGSGWLEVFEGGGDAKVLDDAERDFEGGSDRDLVVGNDLDNTLTGGGARDLISGGSGDDSINGNAGDDLIYGGTGDDTLSGGPGDDRILGGDGMDTSRADTAGNDLIRGNDGRDTLIDPLGRNELYGGLGADTLDGRDDAADKGTTDMLYGGYGADTLNADAGDVMTGGDGMDNFTIFVAPGIDTVHGPVLVADLAPDESVHIIVAEATEEDQVTARLAANGTDTEVIYRGETVAVLQGVTRLGPNQVIFAPLSLVGSDEDDTLTGTDLGETITGGAGDDTLLPGAGDDVTRGGPGADIIRDSAGLDEIDGGTGPDLIDTQDSDKGAPDIVRAGPGDDTLLADDDDTVTGGPGADRFVWNGLDRSSLQLKPITVKDYTPGLDKLEANLGFGPFTPSLRLEDTGDGDTFVRVNGKALFRLQGISAAEVNTADIQVNRL